MQVQHVSVEDRPPIRQHQVSLATPGFFAGCFAIPGMIICSTADLTADLVLQKENYLSFLLSAADGILALLGFRSFRFRRFASLGVLEIRWRICTVSNF